MMSCERVQRLTFLLASGELKGRRQRSVEAHLAGCSACAAFHAEARGIVSAAQRRAKAVDGPSPWVMTRIAAHAREQAQRPVLLFRLPAVQWAAAALLMILLVGWWSLIPSDETRSDANRIGDVHAILAIMSSDEESTTDQSAMSEDDMLRQLAQRLLQMEGLAPEEDSSGEEFLAPPATTPQSHNMTASPSKTRV